MSMSWVKFQIVSDDALLSLWESILIRFWKISRNLCLVLWVRKLLLPTVPLTTTDLTGRFLWCSLRGRRAHRSVSISSPSLWAADTENSRAFSSYFLASLRYSYFLLVSCLQDTHPSLLVWAFQPHLGFELVVPRAGWISAQGLPRWLHQSFPRHISIMWTALLTKPIISPLGFQLEKGKATSLMAHRLMINILHVPAAK